MNVRGCCGVDLDVGGDVTMEKMKKIVNCNFTFFYACV